MCTVIQNPVLVPVTGPHLPQERTRVRAARSLLAFILIALAAWSGLELLSVRADDAEREAQEAARIAELLQLGPGHEVADIGAGDGEWTLQLAAKVGPNGHVYATEIKQDLVDKIGKEAERAGFNNVSAILSGQRDAGLPVDCCDAMLIRKVYHHFTDPAAINGRLIEALRPGGRVAIIDHTTFLSERVKGVPENRSGHGLESDILTREVRAAGFEVEKIVQPWMDEAHVYCILARRPLLGGG